MKKRVYIFLLINTILPCSFIALGYTQGDEHTYCYPDCNVILISIDALRADHLGCYGYHRNTSPHIDTFAEKSIIFENAFSHIADTWPSHMTMLCSLYPSIYNLAIPDDPSIKPQVLSDSIITLPQILKKNGYTTGAFVVLPGFIGFDRGFDWYHEGEFLHWWWINEIKYVENKNFFEDNDMFKWIEANKNNKFFLFFHTYAVHDPYISPNDKLFTNPDYKGSISSNIEEMRKAEHSINYFDRFDKKDERDIQHLVDLYDGCIVYIDKQLAAFFKKLDEFDLLDKSIVIITADHGEAFGEHGDFGHGHGSFYNECLHIPLIIKLPDNIKKRIKDDVALIDLTPTILALVGIKFKPPGYFYQGIPLIYSLKGKLLSRDIYTESINGDDFTLKTKQWKFISLNRSEDFIKDCQLFDITVDPGENDNVIGKFPSIAWVLYQRAMDIYQRNIQLKEKFKSKKSKKDFDKETIGLYKTLGYFE